MGICDSILVKPDNDKDGKKNGKNKISPKNDNKNEDAGDENETNINEEDDEDESDELEFNRTINSKYVDNIDELKNEDNGLSIRNAEDMNEDEAEMLGKSIKPWKGAIFAPDEAPEFNPEEPEENLEIEWIYGYTSHIRRCIGINDNNNLVYSSASLSIIYDIENHTQLYSKGNNDDISSFAQNPINKNIFATGQVATIVNKRSTQPHISVFDSSNTNF